MSFKPGVLERKVYVYTCNNDDKTLFFRIHGSGSNALTHLSLANVNTGKKMFYPFNKIESYIRK